MTGTPMQIVVSAEDNASSVLNRISANGTALGRSLSTNMTTAGTATKKTTGFFGSLGTSISRVGRALPYIGAGAIALGGLVKVGFDWVQQAQEADAVQRKLANTLDSMAVKGRDNLAAIQAQNNALALMSGIDDDAIAAGTNLLATFGGIGPMFDEANAAMVDFAVQFTDGNMESAALMLGKALDKPAEGLERLSRAGVSFTAQQEKQITAMVEANDVAGAQAIMLAEVERQSKGAAKAGVTWSDKLSTAWGQFTEFIGGLLSKYVVPVQKGMTRFFTEVTRGADNIGDVWHRVWSKLKDWLTGTVWPALTAFFTDKVVPALKTAWDGFLNYMSTSFLAKVRSMAAGAVGLHGFSFTIGSPPEGATGGIVTRPTFALIGERGPEAVVPLNRTRGSSPLPAWGVGHRAGAAVASARAAAAVPPTINITVNHKIDRRHWVEEADLEVAYRGY